MPVTETMKPSDGVRKKTTDSTVDSLVKKRSDQIRDSSVDNQSRGDDISPPRVGSSKKPGAKKVMNDNNNEKKVKPSLVDKVPKKGVQRAKASTALNRTIEAEERKKHLPEMEGVNRNSATVIRDNLDDVKLKSVRSKPRQTLKSSRPGSEKRVPSGKKKNWVTVVKKKSELEVKEEAVKNIVEEETKAGEIQSEGVPLSSCSFFEKLQQGVRAYFASRNSLTDDKSKKKVTEGGIRTGAGVAKRRKEETKARTQGNKIKNKIKNLDSDLFYDRPRLKSNSEGQTNNFLNKKPKILLHVKRKKLYHPKKHYVRIQIPRKGYFYRSVELRPSQSATDPVDGRLESASLPKKSEIQIARLASTSPKGSDILKKRLAKPGKKISKGVQRDDEFSLVYDYLEAINFILNHQMVAQEFEKEVNRAALDWPIEVSITPEDVSYVKCEEKPNLSENLDFEEDKQSRADGYNLLELDSSATKIKKQDEGLQIESAESYSVLETEIYTSALSGTPLEWSDFKPDPSFDILMQYLRDSQGKEQRYGPLEISPIMMIDKDFDSNFTHETSAKLENIKKPVDVKTDKTDKDFLDPLKEEYCIATAFCEFTNDNTVKLQKSEEQFANLLIGDIDLHSELQNYLKQTSSGKKYDRENTSSVVNQNDWSFDVNKEKDVGKNFDSTPDGETDQTEAHLKPVPEFKSSSDATKFQTNENLRSHTTNGVKKVQWETDLKQLTQEAQQIAKKVSFSDSDTEEKEKLVSSLVSFLFKTYGELFGGADDCYEKVSPMGTTSKAKKSKSKLLLSDSRDSMPEEQILSKIKNTNSESNQSQRNESVEADGTKTEEDTEINQPENSNKWCPTLDDLADIYSCILKQNSKKKNSKKSKSFWYSSIMSILRGKLHEKQNKMDLINFTKTLKTCFKPPPDWNSGADTNASKKLQEYVKMFQEVLLSSLSIEQITYLNNVISSLQEQESSSECYALVNGVNSVNSVEPKKSNSEDEIEFNKETSMSSSAKPQKNIKTKEWEPAQKTSASVQSKACSKAKSSLKKIKPVEKPKKVAVSPPAELEKVLKSTFNSEKINNRNKTVDKILVNVKVCGSRVLVNDFAYIRDERSLCSAPSTRDKVSELIIENITGDKLRKAAFSDFNEAPSKREKPFEKSMKKKQNIKIVVKTPKSGNQNSAKKLKIKNDLERKSLNFKEQDKIDGLKISVPAEECKDFTEASLPDGSSQENNNLYEYDQERLKTQHPIEAIIEASESRIMENVESSGNTYPSQKRPGETKDLNKLEIKKTEEALNEKTLPERLFSNDLIRDLGFSNDDIVKDLVQTKSYDLNLNRDQILDFSVEDDKNLNGKQTRPKSAGKKNKKVPLRPQNTLFCYSSLVIQDKSVKVIKKKGKETDLKVAKKVSTKAVKKTESKAVKTTSVKAVKKSGSNVVKDSGSKSGKKRDSRVVKTTKTVKKTESRAVNNTKSKEVEETKLNENVEESDEMVPTLPGQARATDSLTTTNTEPFKYLEDAVFYMRRAPDFGSETLSHDNQGSSHLDKIKQKQKLCSEPSETFDKYRNSPIVIFSTAADSDDVISEFAMIRSDSVLRTLPHTSLNPYKIDSVSESYSDLKFYPGRISDSVEEQKPWVTFILTPQQQAQANLPADQVKIVDKPNQENHEGEGEEKKKEEEEEDSENDQIPLSSIEKFIDELRESNMKVIKQEKNSYQQKQTELEHKRQKELEPQRETEKPKNERKKSSSSVAVKKKIKWSPSELSKTKVVKSHDCLKNKTKVNILEMRRKGDKKQSGKETVLAKVIVNILEFLLNEKYESMKNNKQFDENSESEDLHSALEDDSKKWGKTEKTTSEMLNTIINGVTKFEKLVKKNKLIIALKTELKRKKADPKANVDGLLELSKQVDALKSLQKLTTTTLRKNSQKETEQQKVSFSKSAEVKPVKCLLPTEAEMGDIKRKPSTYFDAEERAKGETGGSVNQLEYQMGEPFAKKVLEPQGAETGVIEKDNKESYSKVFFTSTDENFLSLKMVSQEVEEIIFSKIYENLGKNNVFYSMALFDSLLKKKGILDKDEKLQSVLQTVNQKSENLMAEMEKSAWTKLHYLLDEVSKVYELPVEGVSVTGSMYKYIANHLNRILGFISNIQIMKRKLADLQNYLSQRKICGDFDLTGVFSKFVTGLRQLKNAVIPRLTYSAMRFFENENLKNSSGYDIRTVKSAYNLCNATVDSERESQIQFLKNQIRDQRLFIEYLINNGSGSSSSDINSVKDKVSEKIMVLEKSMSFMARDEDARYASREMLIQSMTNSLSLDQISSSLNYTKTSRRLGNPKQAEWIKEGNN